MRDPFANYDAWKTASPYDDESDVIHEAENWLKRNEAQSSEDSDDPVQQAYWIIKNLLDLEAN